MPNYILKELNKELTDGKKVVFPKMQTYSQHDFETVLKHMQTYAGNFSEGTMRAVIDALVETMKSWMPMGHSMKIDGLGTFSLSLGFKDKDTDEEPKTKYRHICIKGINFKPDAKLIAALNKQADFERAEKDVVVPRKCNYTTNERIEKAQAIIANNGFMTLSDYARATGQCRSAASNDLKRLTALPDSPIATRGSGSHKVWVRRG
jgi:predicted histone-like DNA-binding protein